MSALPFLLSLAKDMQSLGHWDEDHDFGLGILPRNIRSLHRTAACPAIACPRNRGCPYAVAQKAGGKMSRTQHPAVGKHGFQVCVDVQQFKPSELTVKTVNNTVVVEGKHEEREDDHGVISRHFVRKYTLPKHYDPSDVVSTLSSDGVLTVKAAPPKSDEAVERVVQIQHTGPAHLSVKENSGTVVTAASADGAVKDGVKNGEKSSEKMEG